MTKRMTSQTQAGSTYPNSALPMRVAVFFAASLLVGCSSSSSTTPNRDSATDQSKDTVNTPIDNAKDVVIDSAVTDGPNKDGAVDAGGCYENGQFYGFGATVTRPGNCTATCTCLSSGVVGQCTSTCLDGAVADNRPPADAPADAPITCTRAGQSYNPGETVPLGDSCGGTCVCLSNGTLGGCSAACPVDGGLDLAKDTNPDGHPYDVTPPVDVTPPLDSACTSGTACTLTNGNKGFCAAGACTACAGATDDTKCKAAYGTGNICLSGSCTAGDCHDSTTCSTGRVCGSSVAHACGDCTTDAQCTGDAHYGTGFLCVNNLCVAGNCHDTSAECANLNPAKPGQVCGATTAHTCGACTSDTQCANDATYATTKPICTTTAGAAKLGQCVANPATGANRLCANADNNHVCPVNSADFCCGNQCVPGNCCDDTDCASLGANFNCRQNTCTQCNAVTGNDYLVDPVDGDDTGATGSGMSGATAAPGCSFRTIKKALSVITASGTAPANTTITIVGRTTATTLNAADEAPPIVVPANVTITTKTGPVTFTPGATKTGFTLVGHKAGIAPSSDAPLTIQGGTGTGGKGIVVNTANPGDIVTLKYVTVNNSGSDGIQIVKGTANFLVGVSVTNAGANGISISGTGAATMNAGLSVTDAGANGINISGTGAATIGPGVTVRGAGTTANPANGLNISGTGTATITVGVSEASTAFDSNSQYGIAVADTGVLTIAGAVPTTGSAVRTISAKSNTSSNVYFASSSATVSTIDYFYSYGSTEDGLQIAAGSTIRVRHSVFRKNAGDGIHITSVAASTTSILTDIDLGSTGDAGNNILQSGTGADQNTGAGLCVSLTTGSTAQTLNAKGNQFAGVNCTAGTPAIAKNATCTLGVDLGIILSTGPAVTVDTTTCTHTP